MACKKCTKVDSEKLLVSYPVEIAGGDFNSGGYVQVWTGLRGHGK